MHQEIQNSKVFLIKNNWLCRPLTNPANCYLELNLDLWQRAENAFVWLCCMYQWTCSTLKHFKRFCWLAPQIIFSFSVFIAKSLPFGSGKLLRFIWKKAEFQSVCHNNCCWMIMRVVLEAFTDFMDILGWGMCSRNPDNCLLTLSG